MSRPTSTYSSHYERMSGNCTRILAQTVISTLSSLSPPITNSSWVLDNACGPGIVTQEIKKDFPGAKITAADLSTAMIDEAKEMIKKENLTNVETEVLDVRNLDKLGSNTFTHAITNLGLPVPGDPTAGPKVTQELYRVLQVGGVAVLTTWADRVWLTAFYNAARSVRPDEPPQTLMALTPDELSSSWLVAQLEAGGFGNNIEVRSAVTYTQASSLHELVSNMMLADGMFFVGYSEAELQSARRAFREEVQKLRTYEEFDGGVRIGMKAWIGIGWKRGDEDEVAV